MTTKLPALFISHGGGPWPFIPEARPAYARTEAALRGVPSTLSARPRAILAISGHWEEEGFVVSTAERPPMVYDYSGFPEHTYRISYPAPGSPQIASEIGSLLAAAGFLLREDPARGFDHGTFVPLSLMYPEADIPVVSLSISRDYDPGRHLALGRALSPLRERGVLILGSGLTYHNMRGFGSERGAAVSLEFGEWLRLALADPDPVRRERSLRAWSEAPSARLAHPREDHLVPLFVAAGAAEESPGVRFLSDHVMGVAMDSYRFG